MSPTERATRRAVFFVGLSLALTACGDKAVTGINSVGSSGTAPTRRVIGVAELRFDNATTINVTSRILLATTIADLERLRATATPVGNLAVIQLQSIITGEFATVPQGESKTRFLRATYGLRNVGDSALFDPSRENLTFVPVQTSATLTNTAVRLFQRADGTAASGALALQLQPTQLMALDGNGNLITLASDVEATVSADDVRKTALPTGASAVLPFSFVVHRFPSGTSAVDVGPFDGEVTFAFRFPEQPNSQDNPTTISVLFLIVQNTAAAATP